MAWLKILASELLLDTLRVLQTKKDDGPIRWQRAYRWCFTSECDDYCDVLGFNTDVFRKVATEIRHGTRKLNTLTRRCLAGTKPYGAKKNIIYLTHWGEKKRLDEWAIDPRVNKKYETLYHRHRKKWSPELVLEAPVSNALRIDKETMTIVHTGKGHG